MDQYAPWILFNLFVLSMLAIDLGVFHRKAHVVPMKEAIVWSVIWITLALAFNGWIIYARGTEVGLQFFTGYLIEKSLSIDNIFVFIMIFQYFAVPAKLQHKVLFWGIIGALIMRAVCIWAGISLLERFHWIIYIFGAFLIATAVKMIVAHGKEIHPERNPVLNLLRRVIKVAPDFHEDKFFIHQNGRRLATPLFIVLLMIETTDLIFAVDSIPAILAITSDPYIVYTSNVFAILGLRSLYFALSGFITLFAYLHYGLAAVLAFVGSKMILTSVIGKFPIGLSLAIIASIIAVSIVASILFPPKEKLPTPTPEST